MFRHYKEIGVSARQIAKRAGLNETGISQQRERWTNGGQIEYGTLVGLKHAFEVPWEWLMDGEGWPSEEIRRRHVGSMRKV